MRPTQQRVDRDDRVLHVRPLSSRAIHRFGDYTAHSGATLVVAVLAIAWGVVGVVAGFPPWWETVLYSVSASVTLVMVFAIQHTQSRLVAATQRKLDELLRTTTDADNRLIAAEHAPDAELDALTEASRADRAVALDEADQ